MMMFDRLLIRAGVLAALVFGAGVPGLRAEDAGEWRERAAAHARILSQVTWTPVADTMPNRKGGYFERGVEQTGVPYSSVKSEGRYIGFDIALRTFLAAVENPLSVLYTENLADKTSNAAAYYGTVCSSYTSYALQCGIWEVSRRHGPDISEGVVLVEPQSAQAAEVGDVIYTPHATASSGSHVEMVTAVERDARGRVVNVRVEESRPPTTKTTDRDPKNFDAHLAARNKQLFRVTNLAVWRGENRAENLRFPNYELDAAKPVINRALLLDLGDWVPYKKGQPVRFHVMDIPLEGTGVHERKFDVCGDYTARVMMADGSESQACEFAVCDLELKLPPGGAPLSKDWEVRFGSDNMDVIAVYLYNEGDSYGRHPLFVSAEQRERGVFPVPAGLLKKPGNLQVWLIGEHPLGRLKERRDVRLAD
jgi:hypothetical protein